MDGVILKKDGFWSSTWSKRKHDHVVKRLRDWRLLEGWSRPLTIEKDVVFGDWVRAMKKLNRGLLVVIEMLCDSSIRPYLDKVEGPAKDTDSDVTSVEVYQGVEISNYDLKKYDITFDLGCHGRGRRWHDEYSKKLPLEQRGNSYAIEFTDWGTLWDKTLRIDPKVAVNKSTWVIDKRKRKPNAIDKLLKVRRKPRTVKEWRREEACITSMSLGEFFIGLTSEVCFFSTPSSRDGNMAELNKRIDDVKEVLKDG